MPRASLPKPSLYFFVPSIHHRFLFYGFYNSAIVQNPVYGSPWLYNACQHIIDDQYSSRPSHFRPHLGRQLPVCASIRESRAARRVFLESEFDVGNLSPTAKGALKWPFDHSQTPTALTRNLVVSRDQATLLALKGAITIHAIRRFASKWLLGRFRCILHSTTRQQTRNQSAHRRCLSRDCKDCYL